MRFWKRRKSAEAAIAELGHLEFSVMEILWREGGGSVREVAQRLPRPLAYTTVMTTLDRLYKKGLLERRKQDRAFWYSPRLTRCEWERRAARDVVNGLLSGSRAPRETIMSCLIEQVGEQEAAVLDELERRIQQKRRELENRKDRK